MVIINKESKHFQIESIISNKNVDYIDSLKFMENHVKRIINNNEKSLIWLLYHPKIYTYGNTSKKSDFLKKPEIPIFQTNRGGQVTYHGPGQRIIYFIIDLNKIKKDVRYFISLIEKIAIDTLKEFGIKAVSRRDRVGIWVTEYKNKKLKKEKKIGSIGIRIKKWVSYHGLSININPELKYFKNIVPCGIKDYEITSFEDLGISINEDKFDKIILKKSRKYLNFRNSF